MDVNSELVKLGLTPLTETEINEFIGKIIKFDILKGEHVALSGDDLRHEIEKERILSTKEDLTEEYMEQVHRRIDTGRYKGFINTAEKLITTVIQNKNEILDYLEKMSGFPIREFFFRYKILNFMGPEENRQVFKVSRLADGKTIVVKIIPRYSKEVTITTALAKPGCHPYIVCPYYNFYDEISETYILELEYIEGKTMEEYFTGLKGKIEDGVYYRYLLAALADIGCILDYIHAKGIIHRDLHGNNIIIDKNNNPHIIDFDLSCYENVCDVDRSYDVFTLGTTFYRIITGNIYKPGAKINTSNETLNEYINSMLVRKITSNDICIIKRLL